MARDLDLQLLEAVAVRRGRLRESLLWGRERRRRSAGDTLKLFVISLVLAAVGCAGCVGWSFLQDVLADRATNTAAETSTATSTGGAP
jgi:hypothetical protein